MITQPRISRRTSACVPASHSSNQYPTKSSGMLAAMTKPNSRHATSRHPFRSICVAFTSVSTLTIMAASGSDSSPVNPTPPMVMRPNAKPVRVCA
jgi:hypothetical protein